MSESVAGLGAGAAHPQVRTFWKLAAAMFEAQHHGLLAVRRLHQAGRIAPAGAVPHPRARRLRRLRAAGPRPAVLLRAGRAGAPRLRLPRLSAARAAYGSAAADADRLLAERARPLRPGDRSPTRSKRVAAAKEAWSATAGGEMHRTGRPRRAVRAGRRFAAAACSRSASRSPPSCSSAVAQTQQSSARAAGAAGDGGGDQPALHRGGARGRRLRRPRACRPRAAPRRAPRRGAPGRSRPSRSRPGWRSSTGASPTARPWAASSRSCAPRSSEAEKSIDQFFRNPTEPRRADRRAGASSSSMRGVLSVLGMDQASQALLRMRDEVDGLVSTEVDPRADRAGRRVRSPRRQPERARLPDRHAERAAAARPSRCSSSTPDAATLAPADGRSAGTDQPGTAEPAPVEPRLIEAGADARLQLGARGRAGRRRSRATSSACRTRRRRPTSRRWPPRC